MRCKGSHYWDVYNQEINVELKPSILKECPKISKNHSDSTSLPKMRVKLMTQLCTLYIIHIFNKQYKH